MNPFDTIKQNYNQSQLGQAMNSLPSDNRTDEEKIKDMIASDPNTPSLVAPDDSSTPAVQAPMQPQPAQVSQGPSPASFVPANQSASGQIPNAGQNLLNGYNQQIADVGKLGQAQAGVYNQQAKGLENQGNILNDYKDKIEQQQQDLKDKLDPVQKVSDDLNDQIQNFNIDPKKFYADQSTGNKVLTGIGLALSAFGGPQAVQTSMKFITDAVQRDVDGQKLQYEQLKDKKVQNDSIYAKLRQQGLDDQAATTAAYGIMLDQAKKQTDAMALRAQSPVALANNKLLQDGLEQQKNQTMFQLATTPVAGQPLRAGYQPIGQDQMERYVPGFGLAPTKDAATKLRETAAEVNPVLSSLSALKDIATANPNDIKNPYSEAGARAQSALGQLTTNTLLMNGIKRQNPDLYKLMQDQGSDITKWTPNAKAKFDQYTKGIAQTINGKVAPYISNRDPQLGATLGALVNQ